LKPSARVSQKAKPMTSSHNSAPRPDNHFGRRGFPPGFGSCLGRARFPGLPVASLITVAVGFRPLTAISACTPESGLFSPPPAPSRKG
jgi:hypothetical protein